MLQVPFHLHYNLSRSQRLVPLLRFSGTALSAFAIIMFLFFVVESVLSMFFLDLSGVGIFAVLASLVFCIERPLFVVLLDVLRVPVRNMDIVVESNAAGILIGKERWYLFLDGIVEIRKYRSDVWTIRHSNGTLLQIAAAAINEDQLDYFRAAMKQGQTPEGIQTVMERGRKITRIMAEEKLANPKGGAENQ